MFCICVVIVSTIYSAMPMSLVGSKFYELYERHMEKMVIKRVRCVCLSLARTLCTCTAMISSPQLLLQTGSTASSRATKRNLNVASASPTREQQDGTTRSVELFALSERDLEILHLFMSMKRTLLNLQRNLDNFSSVGLDIAQQRKHSSTGETPVPHLAIRKTDSLEHSIEQKSNAIMVRVLLSVSRMTTVLTCVCTLLLLARTRCCSSRL